MNHDPGRRNIKLAPNENAGRFSASHTLRKKPEKGSVQASDSMACTCTRRQVVGAWKKNSLHSTEKLRNTISERKF
jgi:hypothetical protein